MAVAPDASQTTPAQAPAAPRRIAPMLIVAVLAAGLGAGATFWLVRPAERAAGSGDALPAAGGEAAAAAPLVDRILTLDPFVVNVQGERFQRFLKTRIEIELATPADRTRLAERRAEVRDAILVLLSSKRLEDLDGFEGKAI